MKFQAIAYRQSFYLLMKDFDNVLTYIEPCDNNLTTYSHRLYEIFLRASTEFESICKDLLKGSNYSARPIDKWGIKDYFTLSSPRELTKYIIRIDAWDPIPKRIMPFKEWDNKKYTPLPWYQDYNEVKHNRNNSFKLASLENSVFAMGSIFVILYSAMGEDIFSQYQETAGYNTDSEGFKYSLAGNLSLSIQKFDRKLLAEEAYSKTNNQKDNS